MAESETVYGLDRAKFEGFGKYKLDIERKVNEIMEMTKKNIQILTTIYYGSVQLIMF